MRRANSFQLRASAEKASPPSSASTTYALQTSDLSAQPPAEGTHLTRTLSAPRARARERAPRHDALPAGAALGPNDDHTPGEWLRVIAARISASDPTLRRLRLSAHVELGTLSRAQQLAWIGGLSASRHLIELELDKLRLDDASARALANLITPTGAAPRAPPLERLSAERNIFSDAGALAFCAALATNAQLRELSIADQLRPYAQATVRAFCEMLDGQPEGARANLTLRRLSLGSIIDPANTLRQRLSKLIMRNVERARRARERDGGRDRVVRRRR